MGLCAVRGKALRRILLGVIVVLAAAGIWQARKDKASETAAEDLVVGLTLYQGEEGIRLPKVKGATVEGEKLDLAGYRGHVLVLNVWGSWCAPCRAEAPDLVEVAAESEPRGVRFVGIDVRDNPAAARAFARRFGVTYPSFDDQGGRVLAQFSGIVPVAAVPSTLVVDKAGIVRARVIGVIDAATLRGVIQDVEQL